MKMLSATQRRYKTTIFRPSIVAQQVKTLLETTASYTGIQM